MRTLSPLIIPAAQLLSLALIPVLSSAKTFTHTIEDKSEIALASEAAPHQITFNASFMKFIDGKFQTIKKGENNFTCLVIREPKGTYLPACFNNQAMRSVFSTYEFKMQQLYSGKDYDETSHAINNASNEGTLPTAELAALVYMMSPNNKFYNHKQNEL